MTKQLVTLHNAIITYFSCFIMAISAAHASELSFKNSILVTTPAITAKAPTTKEHVLPAAKTAIFSSSNEEPSLKKSQKEDTKNTVSDKVKTKKPTLKIAQPIKPVLKKSVKAPKAVTIKKVSTSKPTKKAALKSKTKRKKAAAKKVKSNPIHKTKTLKSTPRVKSISMIQRFRRKKRQTIHPALLKRLMARKNLRKGDPIFIRIFKQEGELELWMRSGRRFSLLKTYDICKFSGNLGPKLAENDRQSPEGFYSVNRRQMKPDSAYYRAFNIGYPNKFDRSWGRTGSLIMVHGACQSVGCFAMTNKVMGEIYDIADAALKQSQKNFPVHIFPFRLTAANMDRYKKHRWSGYWWNLKRGYDMFEQSLLPPITASKGRLYTFSWPKEPKPIKRKPIISWNSLVSKAKRFN